MLTTELHLSSSGMSYFFVLLRPNIDNNDKSNWKKNHNINIDVRALASSYMVRASPHYTKAAGWIPSQGTYKNQPINE